MAVQNFNVQYVEVYAQSAVQYFLYRRVLLIRSGAFQAFGLFAISLQIQLHPLAHS